MKNGRIVITYCTRCKWMLRATWIAQELLTTFEDEIGQLTLKPDATGGVFTIHANDALVFSKKDSPRFPELKDLKQVVRDHIAPGKSLGHSDNKKENIT